MRSITPTSFIRLLIAIGLTLALSSCSSIGLTNIVNGLTQTPGSTATVQLILPAPLATGDSVVMQVMDPLNPQGEATRFIPLTSKDELTYIGTIEGLDSTVLHYRFLRQGAGKVTEGAPDLNGFATRIAVVSGTEMITDVLARWADENSNSQAGVIRGRVVRDDGQPISGVLIAAGGAITRSNGLGEFTLAGLTQGTHTLTAIDETGKFLPFQQQAVVQVGMLTQADFTMKAMETVNVVFDLTVPSANPYLGMPRLYIATSSISKPLSMTPAGTRTTSDATVYQYLALLPKNTSFTYRYSFGNQTVNAEQDKDGDPLSRSGVSGADTTQIEDTFDLSGTDAYLTTVVLQDASGAGNTDALKMTLDNGSFGESIPMQKIGDTSWSLVLAKPINWKSEYTIKVCRSGICEKGDSDLSAILSVNKLDLSGNNNPTEITIKSWGVFSGYNNTPEQVTSGSVRSDIFRYGVSMDSPLALASSGETLVGKPQTLGANLLILPRAYQLDPGVSGYIQTADHRFEMDSLESALISRLEQEHMWFRIILDRKVSINGNAPFDDSALANEVGKMLLAEATAANNAHAEAIVLDLPALWGRVPLYEDATGENTGGISLDQWQQMITEIRARFAGKIYFVINYGAEGISGLPAFSDSLDGFVIQWHQPLGNDTDAVATVYEELQNEIVPNIPTGKYIFIDLPVPSRAGVLDGCFNGDETACGEKQIDEAGQAEYYRALLGAIDQSDNIEGVISDGFDPSLAITDLGESIYNKQAGNIAAGWYAAWGIK